MSIDKIVSTEEDQPIKTALAIGGAAIAFVLPHVASLGGGTLKGVLDAKGPNSFGAEYTFPTIAGSAVYRGVVRGTLVAIKFPNEKPVKEGVKAAGSGTIIFPLEFGVGYGFGYLAGKILY